MNKRQLKKMSRAAADWFIGQNIRSHGEVLFEEESGEWVWFSDLIEGDYDDMKCIDMAITSFHVELTNWDTLLDNGSNWDAITPIYPRGFLSMSRHKRLLFAIDYLKTHATN